MPHVARPPQPLSAMAHGQPGRICGVRMTPDQVAWLAALGLPVGEDVVVLRRAPFGGPLHVRAGSGAEFALDLDCALGIDVVPAAAFIR
ncbi:MAG: FeoA family protein [Deltaproteobacteria bacterium]|nr:FeoA family protein [Deltaproteobacteria bacterium]